MKLSIVMLAYNQERFIAQALDSILMQETTYDYEVILGEDCSTDATREIIKSYESKFGARLKPLYRDKNLGALKNLIDCVEHCNGEYLAFLEGDDYWESPQKIELQINYMDTHSECVMCASNWNRVDINGNVIDQGLDIKEIEIYDEEQYGSFQLPGQTSTLFVRNVYPAIKEKYMRLLKRYMWIPMDTLIIPVLMSYGKIVVLPEITSNYRWYFEDNGSNWSSKHALEARSNWLYFYIICLGMESISRKIGISVDCMKQKGDFLYEDLHHRKMGKNFIENLYRYVQAIIMILLEPHKIRLIKQVKNRWDSVHRK